MIPASKILIVDDESSIRRFLRVSLENEGYAVIEAGTGADGLRELIGARPNIVILDLGLPDVDGQVVLKKIREWSKVPVIVLTVKDDESSKVAALDSGADDYLTKPFGIQELLARLRVAERHANPDVAENSVFSAGYLVVDLVGHVVKVSGVEVHLTATEYDILSLLIKHAGKVVTHRQMLKEIWGPNAVEHTQYLRVYVGQLRKKVEIDRDAKKIIQTEPGVGYRLLL